MSETQIPAINSAAVNENGVGERQPLLPSNPPSYHETGIANDEENADAGHVPSPELKKRSTWATVYTLVLALILLLLLALFIQGFLDADDVEVTFLRNRLHVKTRSQMLLLSLISARL
jgi:hypothetical protein